MSWGEPSPKAWEYIYDSEARLNIAEGSVRSGKTVASLIRWAEYVEAAPPGDLLMAAKTERTLKRNIVNPLIEYLGSAGIRVSWGAGEAKILGRLCYLVGANDERAEGRIRGMTLAGAYGDELTLWPRGFFSMLLSRLSVTGAKFFGTTNPDGPFHWLKTDFLDRAELKEAGDLRHFRFAIEDNPHLDPKFVAALKREYTGLWYKRFIAGLWVLAEGAVYDCFEEARHVRSTVPPGLPRLIAGVDYGTSNPCTFGLYAVPEHRASRRAHLLREYWWDSARQGRQKTEAQYVADFDAFVGGQKPEVVYVDPAAASFILALRGTGYTVKAANNDVLAGIRFVASLLSEDRFSVDPGCRATVEEFQSYVWDPLAAKRGEDLPLKQHDHAQDRNRYALYTHFRGAGSGQVATALPRTIR